MKKNWSILAICQESGSREKAVEFCDQLVRKFWEHYEITVSWVTYDSLLDTQGKLPGTVSEANLVLFAVTDEPIPSDVFKALEACLSSRGDREGFFAGIVAGNGTRNELALRNLAHRAKMDFVSAVPPNLEGALPDSPENCTSRACEVSDLLTDILRHPHSAPPLGLGSQL